jgi:hypothetical protein
MNLMRPKWPKVNEEKWSHLIIGKKMEEDEERRKKERLL